MTIKQPFYPRYGSNQVVAVAAAASVTLHRSNKQARIVNTGANKGYFRIYDSADGVIAATAADCPLGPGGAITVTKGDQDSISTYSAGGTTFEVMVGEGF